MPWFDSQALCKEKGIKCLIIDIINLIFFLLFFIDLKVKDGQRTVDVHALKGICYKEVCKV